jgi:glycosyltransferase involved in cell wall biosynthesis/peptidoglycan/xylan/chitin deacetylase (PgdA/CDA1 family)
MTDRPLAVHIVLSLQPGGLERLVANLVAAPAMSDWRMLVCCLDQEGPLADEVRRAGHEVILVKRRGGVDGALVLRLAAMLRERKARVVHTHSLDPMFYGGLAARMAGVPVRLHTQHNTQVFTTYGWRDRLKFKLAARLFTRVVAVGGETERELQRAGIETPRRMTIRNGIDVTRFAPGRAVPTIPGVPSGSRIIGTAARLSPEKGIHRLLEAFALLAPRHPSARLVLAGDGPDRSALEAQARAAAIADRVAFLGFHPHVAELLPAFEIFALPSLTEGIPLALLEAMAAGIPCVATAVGGVPEVIENGRTGVLVPADDPEALATAIDSLLNDAGRRSAIGAAGREQVIREWSETAMAGAYAALYREDAPVPALKRIGKTALRVLPARWIVWQGPGKRAEVSLTFDDGPDPEFTPRILELLRAHRVRATFFLIGEKVEREPNLVRRIVAEGHELANHSYTHPHFDHLTMAQALEEIDRTEALLEIAPRGAQRLWRPPRGKLNRTSLLAGRRRGLTLVMWNVDLKDFRATAPDDILARLRSRPLTAGDIVLYHGHNEAALAALPGLIAAAAAAGLATVPVSQLLAT